MMKKAIIPVCFTTLVLIVSKVANPTVGIAGLVIAGLIGLGIGMTINEVVFRNKEKSNKEK